MLITGVFGNRMHIILNENDNKVLDGKSHQLKSLSGLFSSVRRALASKLRGPGFKSLPGTVGGSVTICGVLSQVGN